MNCECNNIKDVKIMKTNPNATLPTRGTPYSAGYDLYACLDESVEIKPGEVVKIDAGIATELPNNTFAAIYPRSGLSIKQGLRLANTTGIIDADYRGSWIIALYNDSKETRVVNPGDRIAQMILQKYSEINFIEVEELSSTIRGEGGLGSTGNK